MKEYLDEFIENEEFSDKYEITDKSNAIDVVIPIQNTNKFFRRNLVSIYREIPVNRLLIGDGGASDQSRTILGDFPRVVLFNHSNLNSLGGSLKLLISAVETEFFGYLHSDVYLPLGFYKGVQTVSLRNLWLESNRHSLIVHEDTKGDYFASLRPYSGAQFGDSAVLKSALSEIDDDYLYRNEDLIIKELVENKGGVFQKKEDLVHLHQSVTKNSAFEPRLSVIVQREEDIEWQVKVAEMQYKGIVKYVSPINTRGQSYLVNHVNASIQELQRLGRLNFETTLDWIKETNADWVPYIEQPTYKKQSIIQSLKNSIWKNR